MEYLTLRCSFCFLNPCD